MWKIVNKSNYDSESDLYLMPKFIHWIIFLKTSIYLFICMSNVIALKIGICSTQRQIDMNYSLE